MRIALLNSRKPRHPDSVPDWLTFTFKLASRVARWGFVLRSSIGNEPYEAACYGAARAGGRLEIVTDRKTAAERLDDLLPPGFPRSTHLHLEYVSDTPGPGLERDRRVVEGADLAIAVAVRGRGHMERLLLQRWQDGHAVRVLEPWDVKDAGQKGNIRLLEAGVPALAGDWGDELVPAADHDRAIGAADVSETREAEDVGDMGGVAVGGKTRGAADSGERTSSTGRNVAPGVTSERDVMPRGERTRHAVSLRDSADPATWFDSPLSGPTLAHFTRACPGPWPGQPRWAYYEDLFVGGPRASRDSGAALARILDERLLRAGSRLIRGGYGVVSFTAVKPEALAALHRYQRHLLRWDFEPYGVVFKQSWLEARGARPVRYLPSTAFAALSEEERPWFQKHEPPRCDYSAEQEWRVLGGLDFSDIPEDAIRIVLRTDNSAR